LGNKGSCQKFGKPIPSKVKRKESLKKIVKANQEGGAKRENNTKLFVKTWRLVWRKETNI